MSHGSKQTPEQAAASRESEAERPGIGAALFDMDGVITDTMRAHFDSWKQVFDAFLADRAGQSESQPEPFTQDEYFAQVDGVPRYEGVRRFLQARGIDLPEGEEDDEGFETIRGLGNLKNARFQDWLASNTVPTYDDATALIRALEHDGVKLAVFSSSRNAEHVLKSAGVLKHFDAKVDGTDLHKLGLKGKPHPDSLLEAGRRLESPPAQTIVFEDAVSGVAAAAAGGFGFIIGVDREKAEETSHAFALRASGADLVTTDLGRLVTDDGRFKTAANLPSLWDRLDELESRIGGRPPSLLLDYDGTLTPIVEDYREAWLAPEMVSVLERLLGVCRIAVISGRGLSDLRRRIPVEGLYFAASHGFEVVGPGGVEMSPENADRFLPKLDSAEKRLGEAIASIPGAEIERKKFSIAAHYRQVAETDVAEFERAVDEVVNTYPDLRKSRGKKVYEIQPRADWNKGSAVGWLLEHTALGEGDPLPIYIGDDITDEDAFAALAGHGAGIIVRAGTSHPTTADYALEDPADVSRFFTRLAEMFEGVCDER